MKIGLARIVNPQFFARLDSKGALHLALPLVVMIGVAVGGTYLLVSSQARDASIVDKQYRRAEQSIVKHTKAGSRERIVKIAKKQLGYAERPINEVKFFGWDGTEGRRGPWCAVFASWTWHAAGVDLNGTPYPLQPGVYQMRDTNISRKKSKYDIPSPGDAIIYGPTGGGVDSHIGIVEKASKTRITVIEGNANDRIIRRKINRKKLNDQSYLNTLPHNDIWGYVSPPRTP